MFYTNIFLSIYAWKNKKGKDKNEGFSFGTVSVPPPPCVPEEERDRTETRGPLPVGPQITEHQARAALLAHVADRCCWGTGAAKKMAIAKINYDSAFHVSTNTSNDICLLLFWTKFPLIQYLINSNTEFLIPKQSNKLRLKGYFKTGKNPKHDCVSRPIRPTQKCIA